MKKTLVLLVGMLVGVTSLHMLHAEVHCDQFSVTGDIVCYDRATGAVVARSKGYSGKPGYQNNPSTERMKGKGTIPGGEYAITGVSPLLNNRPLRNTVQLEPRNGTQTYGRDAFRMHQGKINGEKTASEGCIVPNDPRLLNTIAKNGGTGTLTVRPQYPQSYDYGRSAQMPSQYAPLAPKANQSYRQYLKDAYPDGLSDAQLRAEAQAIARQERQKEAEFQARVRAAAPQYTSEATDDGSSTRNSSARSQSGTFLGSQSASSDDNPCKYGGPHCGGN
jgi:hypothetical protein